MTYAGSPACCVSGPWLPVWVGYPYSPGAVAQCSAMLLVTAMWWFRTQLHELKLFTGLWVRSVCHTTDDAAMHCVGCAAKAWTCRAAAETPDLWLEPVQFENC